MMLDLLSVRLFVMAAEFGNLTRTAEAAGTVQPAVSARLKGLETVLGARLLERSPRRVALTQAGRDFLPRARALLDAHEAALRPAAGRSLFRVALSDHATGAALGGILARVRAALPAGSTLEVQVGHSLAMRAVWDEGGCDALVIRREAGGGDGEVLGHDPLGWRGGTGSTADEALPLATLGPPCGVRAAALRALDAAGRPWREAFVAGSCAALLAGVGAGCGVAPMGAVASGGLPDVGPRLGLPALPPSEVVLYARTGRPHLSQGAAALAAGFRAALHAG